MGELRSSIRGHDINQEEKSTEESILYTIESNFNIYNSFYALVDKYPRLYNYKYGESLIVSPIRMWIPRALWSNKPRLDTSVDVLFNELLKVEAERRALAFPIFYEYYLDFGIIGIICMPLLLGFLCKKSIQLYNNNSIIGIISYAIFCGFLIQYINRSYSAQLGTLFVFLYAPMLFYKNKLK